MPGGSAPAQTTSRCSPSPALLSPNLPPTLVGPTRDLAGLPPPRRRVCQQVPQLLVVHLDEGRLQLVLPALLPQLGNRLQDLGARGGWGGGGVGLEGWSVVTVVRWSMWAGLKGGGARQGAGVLDPGVYRMAAREGDTQTRHRHACDAEAPNLALSLPRSSERWQSPPWRWRVE